MLLSFQFRIGGEFGKIRGYLSFCCSIIHKLVFLSCCVLTKAKNKSSVKTMHICFQQEKKNWLDGQVSHWERKSQVQLFVVTVMLRDSLREMLETQLEIWDRVPFSLCDGDTMDRSKLRKWDAQRERSWGAQVRTRQSRAPGRWPKTSVERRCRIHPWEARAGRKEIRGRSEDWGWTSGFGEWSRKL